MSAEAEIQSSTRPHEGLRSTAAVNKAVGSMGKARLLCQYKQLTHGGNYWRDQYLLEYWDQRAAGSVSPQLRPWV
ncbi:hypothetical protein TOPH_02776 [Tolypocladium ophioglossoides CBS 100239]|uniref:Uncharacterized protein n=1 Tax=Tolypocladium ophioglossoides (strain CBS 100239) TaxID=1163406 RepID=A0A0L0NES0_TOLOC|nr:hypothetical protein TOPH_02776 [Tolypocladium ophioglossoides CBS 100239]